MLYICRNSFEEVIKSRDAEIKVSSCACIEGGGNRLCCVTQCS